MEEIYNLMEMKMANVIVTGFETQKQAKEWAEWYSGQGEQDWFIWQEVNGGISGETKSIEKIGCNIILNLKSE